MGIRVEVIRGEHKGCIGTILFENKYYYFVILESSNKGNQENESRSSLVIEKSKVKEIHNDNPSE
ncbi:MAG: hypothetical protein R6U10_02440 [Thermoplasmatota archaeon]